MKYTEGDLIEGCRKGNRTWQYLLYQEFSKRMMGVCLRYSKSVQEAEDILQEGFLKIYQHIKEFKGQSQLQTWMTRIMVNTALNMHRRKLYLFPMLDVEETMKVDDGNSFADLSYEHLLLMIQGLPHGSQIVFNMYAVEGYSHKEIAEQLGISEGTSKSQYARAKELLKKELEKEKSRLKYGGS